MNAPASDMSREEKLALLARLTREKANRPKRAPLAFAQERHYFLSRLDPESYAHNVFRAYRIQGPLEEKSFEAALRYLLRRHESLRATFVEEDGNLSQVIAPPSSADQFQLVCEDLRQDEEPEASARDLAAEEAKRPFDLAAAPPIRWRILRIGEESRALLLSLHHIIADGWSLGILLRELWQVYDACRRGEAPALTPLPISYSDFASWQHEKLDLGAQLAFWHKTLEGAPKVLELATDKKRPPLASLEGDYVGVVIDAATAGRLRQIARSAGATPFMALLSIFTLLLHRCSGQHDLLIGTPIANRHRKETEGLIGSFANTLVLRTRYSPNQTFLEFLAETRRHALGAFDHQDLPFERLVEDLQPERDLSRNPLFQVMFALLDGKLRGQAPPVAGLDIEELRVERGLSKVDLTLEMVDSGDAFTGYFEYAKDLFDRETIERFATTFAHLVETLLENPQAPLGGLSLLDEKSRLLLRQWNDTAVGHDLERTLPAEILAGALRHPGDLAVVEAPATFSGDPAPGAGRRLTYGELDAASANLAARLQAKGIGRGSRVGLCLERSLEAVTAFLAVWRAGAAYVPLDPAYPPERLRYMVNDSELSLILTQEGPRARLPQVEVEVWTLDGLPREPPADFTDLPLCADDLAYLIYTSGSTGRPKGVLVSHRGLKNHALAIAARYQLEAADKVLQFASLSFDLAGEEIYPTLLQGATLVLRSEQQSLALADFRALLQRQGITVANLPTPYWHEWVAELQESRELPPEALRLVVVGTEQALAERLEGWRAVVGERPRWINSYGPSETTITATTWEPRDQELRGVAIGRPIDNLTAHVLDANLEPLPIGAAGELCLGGAGLAHGYHRRPALTAEKFVPDPFAARPGSRLYRSGDRVRFFADGSIEFLGRLDEQVKIRGYRIEVGEIEACLAEHEAVADAVVLARDVAAGEKRLIAYLKLASSEAAPAPGELRDHLAERLPAYMVPSALIFLPTLPLTRSGKVDRDALRRLPLAEEPEAGEAPWQAPRSGVEEVLAEIWSGLLGGRRIGADDDFFRLGGHSLLATRMLSRLRSMLGVELPLKDVFEAPTLAALAQRVAASRSAGRRSTPPIERRERGELLPLSFAQQRMWFLAQLEPESAAYNMPNALRLEGELDAAALERALGEILRRHESLRTTFVAQKGQPFQVVHPPSRFELPRHRVANEGEAHARTGELSRRPFELETEKPIRLELIEIAPRLHWLALIFHHIASDGWSTDLFLYELEALYRDFAASRPARLPELALQYADYAAWQNEAQNEEALAEDLAFWKQRLAGAPTVLELPTDRVRPPQARHRGGRIRVEIGKEVADTLRERGRRAGCSLFMTLLSAWGIFLSRITHQQDILLGTPVAGRHRPEIERLIGFFANTLVLRLDLAGSRTYEQVLASTRSMVLDAYDHQDLPFERLVDEIQPQREKSHNALFQVAFVLHHASPFADPDPDSEAEPQAAEEAAAKALRFSLPSIDNQTSRFDLALSLVEGRAGLHGFIEYDADLFEHASVFRYGECFATLLRSLAAAPADRRIGALELLPPAELARVQKPWPGLRAVDPNATSSIGELFTAVARRYPDKTALTCDGSSLTYHQLEQRSAAIARALRERGVGLESRVGLAVDRTLDLLPAILGILRADAAYVPIDPRSPTDRMAYILEDSGSQILLSQAGLELPATTTPRLDLEAIDLETPGEAPPSRSSGATMAYVIYTSGSTGRPKGVAVSHGNAVRLFSATEDWYRFSSEDVWTLFHSSAFDFSVWEMWGALLYGARLVVVPYFVSRSVEAFYDLLLTERVTILNMTPSMFRQVDRVDEARATSEGTSPLQTLRCVIFGGEAVDLQALAGWWQRHPVDSPQLVNAYGITETTVAGAYRPLDPSVLDMPVASVIGQPFPDLEYYLVDRDLRLVPVGVKGEICVGGAGITRGYLGRPALTAERFVPNPFSTRPGERLYHSGDLGRLLETRLGLELDYHGRIDFQVKIRGFRIELGEVEASLTELEAIHEAVVLAREDEPGDKRLVAYVTLTREATEQNLPAGDWIQRWRGALASRLPDYMIPLAFLLLDSFPLTVNGKVDRKALPAPEKNRSAVAASYQAPRSDIETRVAAIWEEVLGQEKIGVHDDFFELGGHSLLATRVLARLRETFEIDLPLRILFEKKTVAALSEEIVAREMSQADEDLLRRLLQEL